MRCSRCGSEKLSVIDSRSDGGSSIRRRRECQECSYRFTTFEKVAYELPLVIKKGGGREPFSRDKVRIGIMRACEKRPVSVETIEEVLDRIEVALQESHCKEVTSEAVGELVMVELQGVDQIAYVRFASVYREFSDVNQFVDTLKNLPPPPRNDSAKD